MKGEPLSDSDDLSPLVERLHIDGGEKSQHRHASGRNRHVSERKLEEKAISNNKEYKSLERHHKDTKSRSNYTLIKAPKNDEYFKPISVKDRSWGRQKIDVKRIMNTRIGTSVENSAFAKYAKSGKVVEPEIEEPDDESVLGGGFLDKPGKVKTEKQLAVHVMSMAAKGKSARLRDRQPVRQEERYVKGLKVELLDHQVRGLRYFLQREKLEGHVFRGGLLCDDMGLGKTIQMISLILSNPAYRLDDLDDIRQAYKLDCKEKLFNGTNKQVDFSKSLRKIKSTLIICPASLLTQWEQEIGQKTNLTCYLYHGAKRIRNIDKLAEFDVVITSYQTCMSEFQSGTSPLYECYWWRLILDEAHIIKNVSTKTAGACFNLKSLRRWCLTGTPIQNNALELWSLLHFLRVNRFWKITVWASEIGNVIDVSDRKKGLSVLLRMLDYCMIRRNKDVLQNKFKLPPKNMHRLLLEQEEFERIIYKKLEGKVIESIIDNVVMNDSMNMGKLKLIAPLMKGSCKSSMEQKNSYMVVFVYLLRLRQVCCHWRTLFMLEQGENAKMESANTAECSDEENLSSLERKISGLEIDDNTDAAFSEIEDKETEESSLALITAKMSSMSIKKEAAVSKSDKEVLDRTSRHLQNSSEKYADLMQCVKVKKVLEILEKDRKRKTIIFSEFTSVLKILSIMLYEKGFSCLSYNGSMSKTEKQETLERLKTNPKYTVLLCSLKCGSLGLNLTFCSQVILYEPFWNPAVGAQAIDRVYRIGQTKPVDVWEFFVKNSVEQRIRDLQDKKRNIAKAVTDRDQDAIMSMLGSKLSKKEIMQLVGAVEDEGATI